MLDEAPLVQLLEDYVVAFEMCEKVRYVGLGTLGVCRPS
jgi:hypothetical protein